MIPYVIRQGDYLKKLAFTKGFDADEVWNAADNADIKAARPNPDLLCPGDILYVPEPKPEPLPLNVGGESTYTGDIPTVARPIPVSPPVTIATLSFRSTILRDRSALTLDTKSNNLTSLSKLIN